jgi:peptidoglycan hydrolase-like protein with peptidoglycan-binding domain
LRPTNERYKEIETALASRGYLGEEPSGKWGSGSVEALRAFQADHQLPPTGKLGSLSLIQLGLAPSNSGAGLPQLHRRPGGRRLYRRRLQEPQRR